MRNIFLGKSYTKCGGKKIPRTFHRGSNLSISLDQQPDILHTDWFYYMSNSKPAKIY